MALPKRRTRWKSEDFFRRNRLFTDHKSAQKNPCALFRLRASLAVPVCLFDVVIHPHTEPLAAFGAAALEYVSPAAAGHPGAETVYTDTAAFLWLVCSLWHCFPLLHFHLKINANTYLATSAERLYRNGWFWSIR